MVPKTQWPTLSAMFHTVLQQQDSESVWSQATEVVAFCQQKFHTLLTTWKKPSTNYWRLQTRWHQCGRKTGRIIPLNGSIVKSGDVQMSSASSPILTLWCALSVRSWLNNMMTGFSKTATCR